MRSSILAILAALLPPFLIAQTRGVERPYRVSPPGYEYTFERINTDVRFGSNVTSIVRSSTGFLWISTPSAIFRYDSYDIKRYEDDPADPHAKITNQTLQLLEDRSGRLWAGTVNGAKRLDPGQTRFIRFLNIPGDTTTLPPGRITALCQDRSGMLWFGTGQGVIARFDNSKFVRYSLPESSPVRIPLRMVISVIEDSSQVLWVRTASRSYMYDRASDRFLEAEPMNADLQRRGADTVFYMMVDRSNQLWLSTSIGLLCYDTERHLKARYVHNPRDTTSIGPETPLRSVEDAFGNLWVELFGGGIDKLDVQSGRFAHVRKCTEEALKSAAVPLCADLPSHRQGETSIWCRSADGLARIIVRKNLVSELITPRFGALAVDSPSFGVWRLFLDTRNRLWACGMMQLAVIRFDPSRMVATAFPLEPPNSKGLTPGSVLQVYEDPRGTMWLLAARRLYRYDELRRTITHVPMAVLPVHIAITRDGDHWLACMDSGGVRMHLARWDPRTGHIEEFLRPHDEPVTVPDRGVYGIHEDSNGLLWIGTGYGGLYSFDRRTGTYTRYLSSPDDPDALKSTSITGILEDSSGTTWIATHYGLHRRQKDSPRFECIKPGWAQQHEFDGVRESAFIRTMTMDGGGHLWLAVDEYVDRYDTQTGTWQRFRDETGLHVGYATSVLYDSKRNLIYAGGTAGIFFFDPDKIATTASAPPVVITRVKVMDKDLSLARDVTALDTLVLSHSENYLSFTFAALDFANPAKNLYSCYMKGLDRDWVQLGTRRYITYANVDPGVYLFNIRGSGPNGVWNEAGRSMLIIITPPWWRTLWAYIGYVLFGSGLLYALWLYDRRRVKLRHLLQMKDFEAKKMHELDQMKSRFFANISHEFRTPLTLILGPMDQLIARLKDEDAQSTLSTMRRNGLRLLQLINQLLDLSKMDAGKISIQVRPLDLVALARPLVMSFMSFAERKKIQLIFDPEEDEIIAYIDRDKFEKILTNLLSNAFKFTGEGGEVLVVLRTVRGRVGQSAGRGDVGRRVEIAVSDTGIGIEPKDVDRIFDRFYQADSSHTREHEGTGIGLALTKELVELHKGEIIVASTVGKGSTFTVTLPAGKEHWLPEDIVAEEQFATEAAAPASMPILADEAMVGTKEAQGESHKPTLLIVEDNADVRTYIRGFLQENYRIVEAGNGKVALEQTNDTTIDLVISDIMMPVMDGIELCRTLKNDDKTSHIPVILLTARASGEGKLEGLDIGADDYIIKPFDAWELMARVKNLIELRRKLREKYQRQVTLAPSQTQVTTVDERFLKKLAENIEQHITDAEYDTERLAHDMFMSRMQLNRKLQALTGHSTHEIVREFRLQRAAELLRHHADNVSGVAFEVGFNSLSHFARAFRERFGVLPSEYETNLPPQIVHVKSPPH